VDKKVAVRAVCGRKRGLGPAPVCAGESGETTVPRENASLEKGCTGPGKCPEVRAQLQNSVIWKPMEAVCIHSLLLTKGHFTSSHFIELQSPRPLGVHLCALWVLPTCLLLRQESNGLIACILRTRITKSCSHWPPKTPRAQSSLQSEDRD
jgi:hypothetical protein